MGGIPSIPTDKTRTIQVIGAGYSRTGTVSMGMALEKLLDGPVMHGGTQLLGREDAYAKLWCDIFANRADKPVLLKLLREATAGFLGITDAPATMFLPELMELYPDAKVVLVTRDPARWFKSMEPIINNTSMNPIIFKLLLWPCPTWRWAPVWIKQMGAKEQERFGNDFYKGSHFGRPDDIIPPTALTTRVADFYSAERILEYNDHVRSCTRPENMLTMELKEGWEPLAKFLQKPIPDEPFPRANDSEAVDQLARKIFLTATMVWTGILAGSGVAAWGGWTLWKKSMES